MKALRVAPFSLLAALATALPIDADPHVWIVDVWNRPGTDFTTLQPAVNAAADGDVIVVTCGYYETCVVDGKQLTFLARPQRTGNSPSWVSAEVRNLAPDQHVSFRGLYTFNLQLQNNQGPVWIEDSEGDDYNTIVVENCANVVFRNCTWRNHVVFDTSTYPLNVSASTVAFYECDLRGGDAISGGCFPCAQGGVPGHPALRLRSGSTAFAMGSLFVGGDGADGGPAGRGADLRDASTLESGDCLFLGDTSGPSGPDSSWYAEPGSRVRERPYPAHSMGVAAYLAEGETTPLVFTGLPGDVVNLYVSRDPGAWKTYPRRIGPRTLHKILQVIPVGTIPTSGVLSVDFTAPNIPGEAHSFFFQAAFVRSESGVLSTPVYGAPTQTHILDAGL
jgi:hypothetical protein